MKAYWLKGIKNLVTISQIQAFLQLSNCISAFSSLETLTSLHSMSQQDPALPISQEDLGRRSHAISHKSFRRLSYTRSVPYQKHHRGFHKNSKDITHIWLEQKKQLSTAALPMVYGKGIKVERDCWKPIKSRKLSQWEQRTVTESY